MKAKTFIIWYWIMIVINCISIEYYWFAPEPNCVQDNHLMFYWFLGFLARVLLYIYVSCNGCIGLISLLKHYKIK
jgi:hypothetical protein